ncbi:MAG: CBS domain-containing protein [Gammaproteobacteria bacterium]
MKIQDVMTRNVEIVRPDSTIKEAAEKMKTFDVGSVPVCEGDRMIGIVTDRDVTLRATAAGLDPNQTKVRDVMTQEVVYCRPDQEVREATALMEQKKIRRLAVLDDNKRLIGIVSLGDIALDNQDDRLTGEVLERISEPSAPKKTA